MTAVEVVFDMVGGYLTDEAWVMQHAVWLLIAAMGEGSIRETAAEILKRKIIDVIIRGKCASFPLCLVMMFATVSALLILSR